MLSLSDCLKTNRPLMFCSCENDFELLNYLNENHKNHFQVYASTHAKFMNLSEFIKKKFQVLPGQTHPFDEILDSVYNMVFHQRNTVFSTFIFLDVTLDKQSIRKIKDILSKYQADFEYTINMLFINQTIMVPPELERFSEVIYFPLPDEAALKEKSDTLCDKTQLGMFGDKAPTEDVLNNLKGLTLFEVEQAYSMSKKLRGRIDLKFIQDYKKSSIAKTDLLSLMESDVSFDDIGGIATLKEWVKKSYGGWTAEGRKFGLPLLKGVLLVGPPGCGKSLTAKVFGKIWGLPVINFDPSRVFSSRVGASEENIRRILKIIENVSPCILYLDEIEKAFSGSQSSTFSDSGVTSRVIMTFLIWMQECTSPVFTVATSNNIQYMPPELISRFDQTFFVNVPQQMERMDIFKIHLKKLGRDPNNFDCEKLAENSTDFVGREIEQVLKDAMYESYFNKVELSTDIILSCLHKKTNILTTMAEQLNHLFKWVGWDPVKKDGIRARYAHPVEEDNRNRVMSLIDDLIKESGCTPGEPI
jgi:SpoVK/Ycf46/Vps4 family AAA+-type ATPase